MQFWMMFKLTFGLSAYIFFGQVFTHSSQHIRFTSLYRSLSPVRKTHRNRLLDMLVQLRSRVVQPGCGGDTDSNVF